MAITVALCFKNIIAACTNGNINNYNVILDFYISQDEYDILVVM